MSLTIRLKLAEAVFTPDIMAFEKDLLTGKLLRHLHPEQKVRINLEYYHNHTFMGDLRLIFATIFRSYESAELPKLK